MMAPARRLCWHGMLLFFLGLVTGVVIPVFTNPRMGLSAHLAGVQSGMFVVLVGLLWPQLALTAQAARYVFGLLLLATYGTWAGLVLAAVLGTSRSTPIAGAGHEGTAVSEATVALIIGVASVAMLIAAVQLLRGLSGAPKQE